MRPIQLIGGALALASQVLAQTADSKVVCDSTTGICFSSYTNPTTGITFGIALPQDVTAGYDAIISISAPSTAYWAGLAWGGTMVWNPLSVAWPNGNTAVISSRFAFSNSLPAAYSGAEHTLMKGTTANSTHWTVVARCKGCTSWVGNDGTQTSLNGSAIIPLAWAQGGSGVQYAADNNTAFNVHNAVGTWNHDFNAARSSNFNTWVTNNLVGPVPPAPAQTTTSTVPTTISTSVVSSPAPVSTGKVPASCANAGSPVFSSVVASGWKATKVVGGLTNPRSIVFDTLGNMLVVQAGKGISYHAIDSTGCVTSTKMLISLTSLNHGIALTADGKTLYASSMTQAFSWPYTASSGTVGTQTTIITGMTNGGSHLTRTLLLAPQNQKILLVSQGANANFDYAAGNPATGRAIVKAFDLTTIPSGGFNYVSQGYVVGYGLRNEVGITFDANNKLWGVQNSGDDFTRTVNGQSKDIHQNNPAERLDYLGDPINVNKTNWFGYPTCFSVWQPSDFTDATFQVGDFFVVAPNSTYKDANCKASAVMPSTVFQAHSAPIDLKFDPSGTMLFVTFHGSWDRQPTTGFKLVMVPFTKGSDGGYKPSSPLNTQSGYQDIFYNPDVTKCVGNGPSFSSGCFRPAGLQFDKVGRLYMTSDVSNGEIWVLGKS